MGAISVNSISNIYVRTSVAQQRVASDRANVIASESQLRQDEAQLDKDLTYLAMLQKKTQSIQQTEGSQAQETALDRIEKIAQSAQQASQQALATLSSSNDIESQAIGSNVNVLA
ncbi:MAG: hypothetical protein FD173_1779 [Gallionellaceae bacterium]|nr:MAG: hypothetical protein FD173_1779 [Gallionellaceae bacterium]